MRGQKSSKKILINAAIVAPKVRLVGKDGDQVGIVPIEKALAAATEAGLDLVLIAEEAEPPVAKVMDYGKHIFDKKKAKSVARKKQKNIQVKEIKFRPGIEDGDYQIKVRNLVRFLDSGNKAKVTLRFRGREMAHQDIGMEVMKRVEADLEPHGVLELEPKMEGRQLSMVFGPKAKHGKST